MTEGGSWIKSSSSANKCARRWTMKSLSGRKSIKLRSRGLELRPKAERQWAHKHRVFHWLCSHGDSWFDYPLGGNSMSLPHTDIIAQLEFMGNINPCILNISQWGDATTAEMSWPKQQKMITALQDKSNWLESGKPKFVHWPLGGPWNAGFPPRSGRNGRRRCRM